MWPSSSTARYSLNTHPRPPSQLTSHQDSSRRQPSMSTGSPSRITSTLGNSTSGPVRKLTSAIVKARSAWAAALPNVAKAISTATIRNRITLAPRSIHLLNADERQQLQRISQAPHFFPCDRRRSRLVRSEAARMEESDSRRNLRAADARCGRHSRSDTATTQSAQGREAAGPSMPLASPGRVGSAARPIPNQRPGYYLRANRASTKPMPAAIPAACSGLRRMLASSLSNCA